MLPNPNATNVLLPEWLLRNQAVDPTPLFKAKVEKYLLRYPDYQLIEVRSHFAVCDRQAPQEKKRVKRRTSK